MSAIIIFFKQYGKLGLIIIGLEGVGYGINQLNVWNWLTDFFVLLRMSTRPLDFMWDFQTSWQIITVMISVLTIFYSFKAIMIIKNQFD